MTDKIKENSGVAVSGHIKDLDPMTQEVYGQENAIPL